MSDSIAAYGRVSTEEQRERQTIGTQKVEIERFCKRHNCAVSHWYLDEGQSGAKDFQDRPEARRMMEDARAGKFKILLVYKIDRLARDSGVFFVAERELRKLGVQITSVTEETDNSSSGELNRDIRVAFASYERKLIRERSIAGTRRMLEVENAYVGGIVPYGYKVIGEKKNARFAADEDPLPDHPGLTAASLVRRMFQYAAEGKSTYWIADYLNSLAIPTRYKLNNAINRAKGRREVKTSEEWKPPRVCNLLKNQFYKGIGTHGKRRKNPSDEKPIERKVLAIIEPELWDAANARLKLNQKFSNRNRKNRYLLRGLIRCSVCGSHYCGHPGGSSNRMVFVYRCSGRTRYRATKLRRESGLLLQEVMPTSIEEQKQKTLRDRCAGKGFKMEWLDRLVWHDIERFLRNPEEAIRQLSAKLSFEEKGLKSRELEISSLEARLERLSREKAKNLRLFTSDQITEAEFRNNRDEINADEVSLFARMEDLRLAEERARSQKAMLGAVEENLKRRLQETLSGPLSWETRRKLIELFIPPADEDGIVIEPTEKGVKAKVRYRFDPSLMECTGMGSWRRQV